MLYCITARHLFIQGDGEGGSTELVGTPTSAGVVWESFGTDVTPSVGDIVKDISYSDGYVKFSTPSTLNNGNAVIAVKDASGNILWSWHIWVCKGFIPNASAQAYKNNAGTMMDRNLGATSSTPGNVHALGLLYQWGRKDPFLGSSEIKGDYPYKSASSTIAWPSPVPSDATQGTIPYAVSHPTTFITSNSENTDWFYTGSTSTDNTRWQTSDKDKGTYDPCPAGWRVPDGGSYGVWALGFGSPEDYKDGPWDDVNNGMNFGSCNGKASSMQLGSSSIIWYPNAGYLYSSDGGLSEVGDYGVYWSCTPKNDYAYVFWITDAGSYYNKCVRLQTDFARSAGCPVRCMKE